MANDLHTPDRARAATSTAAREFRHFIDLRTPSVAASNPVSAARAACIRSTIPVARGDAIHVRFQDLGSVSMRFI